MTASTPARSSSCTSSSVVTARSAIASFPAGTAASSSSTDSSALLGVLRWREQEDLGVEHLERPLELFLGSHLHGAVEADRERVLVPALDRLVVVVLGGEREGHGVCDLRGAIERGAGAPQDRQARRFA